jgi:hypothetical protein
MQCVFNFVWSFARKFLLQEIFNTLKMRIEILVGPYTERPILLPDSNPNNNVCTEFGNTPQKYTLSELLHAHREIKRQISMEKPHFELLSTVGKICP